MSRRTYGEVATVPGIGAGHHIPGVEHLSSEFWKGDGAGLLARGINRSSRSGDVGRGPCGRPISSSRS